MHSLSLISKLLHYVYVITTTYQDPNKEKYIFNRLNSTNEKHIKYEIDRQTKLRRINLPSKVDH